MTNKNKLSNQDSNETLPSIASHCPPRLVTHCRRRPLMCHVCLVNDVCCVLSAVSAMSVVFCQPFQRCMRCSVSLASDVCSVLSTLPAMSVVFCQPCQRCLWCSVSLASNVCSVLSALSAMSVVFYQPC